MEKAVLMMDYLKVTQKANSGYSHKGDCALDLGGKDSGKDDLKAPFTGVVKRIYTNCNAVWLESKNKVKYADGTEDYMTVLTMHDNDVSNLKVGQTVKQGEIYYQEGKKGNATGNHVHLTVTKGKFTGNGWYKNKCGVWCANNQYDVYKALFLDSKTTVLNDGGYNWIKTNDYEYNNPTSNNLYLNLEPTVSSWTVYKTNKYFIPSKTSDVLAKLNPKKFGGLSYKILEDCGNFHFKIKTDMFGYGYIAGNPSKYNCTITDKPTY